MRSLPVFSTLLFFLLLVSVNGARKDPREYWRSVMKDEPIPKAIEEVLLPLSDASSNEKADKFIRNFDTKPNLILYHSHVFYITQDHLLGSSKSSSSSSSVAADQLN